MAWLKIDDGFMEHPKVDAVRAQRSGDTAICVHMKGMGWCARGPRGTDRRDLGLIPEPTAKALGATPAIVQMLEGVALWDRVEAGWLIHDWQSYQRVDSSTERSRRHRNGDADAT